MSKETNVQCCNDSESDIAPETRDFYRKAIAVAEGSGVPFLVGGSYAFNCYTGIKRRSKDFDIFIHPGDLERLLRAFSNAGYKTEITNPYWLGKVFSRDDFVDVIFGSGKGINDIDDDWFEYSVEKEILGMKVRLCPPEEIIWSKSYIMERERFDGADVAHLFLACRESIDWKRLLNRFGMQWQLLLGYLVLFFFIYPSERSRIPEWLMQELMGRLANELKSPAPEEKICQGTLLSRDQFLVDVERWGYKDARILTGELWQKKYFEHEYSG